MSTAHLLPLLGGILSIILINIILSGDNAVVIAMASRRLPPRERRRAILAGGAGAIGLRVIFTAVASLLLHVPLLQAVGGVLLVWVAWRLLNDDEGEREIAAATTFWGAFQTIIVADLLMSLDNILAVGGAAHGSAALLIFGLVASMPIILLSSSAIARLMNRYGWLSIAGAVILTITAARMVADDRIVESHIHGSEHLALAIVLGVTFSLIAVFPAVRRTTTEATSGD
jgi:YjbE family integral membrane protein